jgi:hypothetical protein
MTDEMMMILSVVPTGRALDDDQRIYHARLKYLFRRDDYFLILGIYCDFSHPVQKAVTLDEVWSNIIKTDRCGKLCGTCLSFTRRFRRLRNRSAKWPLSFELIL